MWLNETVLERAFCPQSLPLESRFLIKTRDLRLAATSSPKKNRRRLPDSSFFPANFLSGSLRWRLNEWKSFLKYSSHHWHGTVRCTRHWSRHFVLQSGNEKRPTNRPKAQHETKFVDLTLMLINSLIFSFADSVNIHRRIRIHTSRARLTHSYAPLAYSAACV